MLYGRDIDPRLERSRFANSLAYLDESQDGLKSHHVVFVVSNGADPETTYDLIRKNTFSHVVSVSDVRIEGWSISEGTGPAGCDQIVFELATLPADGATVLVQYKKQGPPDGVAFGKRSLIEVDEESDVSVIEVEGWERLFTLAGFWEVYNDPRWYWVLVDANDGLNGIWRAMLKGLPIGTKIQFPSEAEVLLQLEGLLDE